MTDIRYKNIRTIENGIVKYKKVEITSEDIVAEKEEEIKNLKALVDSLRVRIEQLEQERQRTALRDTPSDTAESYRIYG